MEEQIFKKSIDAESIDLAKIGWTENKHDKESLSYIRGYIWRNYKVRIKEPLDWIILCMIQDVLSNKKKEVSSHSSPK